MDAKQTPSGTTVGKLTLAVNRDRKRGGKWEEAASFIECALFGKQAENVRPYLTKGRRIGVTGELRQEKWTQDGQNHSRLVVVLSGVTLLGGGNGETQQQPAKTAEVQPQKTGAVQAPEDFSDDEIPF